MTDSTSALANEATDNRGPSKLPLPRRWIASFGLHDSLRRLELERNQTVVIVGANNAGKSAMLRDLYHGATSNGHVGRIVQAVTIGNSSSLEHLLAFLMQNHEIGGSADDPMFWGPGFHIQASELRSAYLLNPQSGEVIPTFFPHFYASMLPTDKRLTGSNPGPQLIGLEQRQPGIDTPPHYNLARDEDLEKKISDVFHQAFGSHLILYRGQGNGLPLYVSKVARSDLAVNDFSPRFFSELNKVATPLNQQGDGMRAFATILLDTVIAEHRSLIFIDEPEAFLHPPQARLIGELIAKRSQEGGQQFIATHSADILEGILSSGAKSLRVLRIERTEAGNIIHDLDEAMLQKIANEPLLRQSGILQGVFYRHVVITEADPDTMFYETLLRTNRVSSGATLDTLFVHAAGKQRLAALAEIMNKLSVPVTVVADIDLLRERDRFQKTFEAVGGVWSEVERQWTTFAKKIEGQKPPPSTVSSIQSRIEAALSGAAADQPMPTAVREAIKNSLKAPSAWDDLKLQGRSGIRDPIVVGMFDELLVRCEAKGLLILSVGELERFCRTVGGKGTAFVAKVFETMDLETDDRLDEACKFVAKIKDRILKPRASVESGPAGHRHL